MTLHHRDMDGIARRQQCAVLNYLTSPQYVHLFDSKNIVNHAQN